MEKERSEHRLTRVPALPKALKILDSRVPDCQRALCHKCPRYIRGTAHDLVHCCELQPVFTSRRPTCAALWAIFSKINTEKRVFHCLSSKFSVKYGCL